MNEKINLNQETEFLSAQEVQRLLKLPKSTLYYLTKIGTLKAIRIGNRLRYPKQALETYLSSKSSSIIFAQQEAAVPAAPMLNVQLPCRLKISLGKEKDFQATGVVWRVSLFSVDVFKLQVKTRKGWPEKNDAIEIDLEPFGKLEGRIEAVLGRRQNDEPSAGFGLTICLRNLTVDKKQALKEFIG